MTETALAVRDDLKLSVSDIKKYIAPTATEKELYMFMGIAKSYGLNPLKREIHFVKRKQKQQDGSWIEVGSTIVGYEVYLKRAERTGKLDGWKCWIEKDGIGEKAVIEIKRKDQSMPIRWEVYRKEFDTEKSTWGKMPTFMLKKVCIAQGFRLAFPDDCGGMPYIPEEVPHEKGGGISEALPKEIEDVPDYPEFAKPTADPEPEKMDNYVYPAHCDCGWIGMADDCKQHRCPNCGERVIKDKDIETITDKQQKRLFARAKATGWPNDELKAYLQEVHGISSTKEIPSGLYDKIIEWIDAHTGYTPKEAVA